MRTLYLFVFFSLSSFSVISQAIDSTGCTGALGDVKYSILDEVAFQGENGICWVLMDGRNIVGSDLHALISQDEIPDARGYFIRSYDNRQINRVDTDRNFGSIVGDIQLDEFKAHDHTLANRDLGTGESGFGPNDYVREESGSNQYTSIEGGSETRPKNITLYTYLRIN